MAYTDRALQGALVARQNITQFVMSQIAMVWSCHWTLSCLGIFVEIFSIRRLYYLRDWCGKWDIGNEYLGPPARGISRGLRSHKVSNNRD